MNKLTEMMKELRRLLDGYKSSDTASAASLLRTAIYRRIIRVEDELERVMIANGTETGAYYYVPADEVTTLVRDDKYTVTAAPDWIAAIEVSLGEIKHALGGTVGAYFYLLDAETGR